MDFNGTRQRKGLDNQRPETRFPNGKYTRDVGLNKNLTISATFTASNSRITDAAADFEAAGFLAGDEIIVWNSALNNGVRKILSVAATILTVDWPVKDEGPTAGVTVRST